MKRKPVTAYLGLGSNLKGRAAPIIQAVFRLKRTSRINLIGVSPIFETDPIGGPSQPKFLNGVVKIKTNLAPQDLLKTLKTLERDLGRKAGPRWGPRVIDLDILFYSSRRIKKTNLVIPHPRADQRKFVMAPLAALAPGFVHPIYRKTARTLLRELTGSGQKVTIKFRWKKSLFQGLSKKRKAANR